MKFIRFTLAFLLVGLCVLPAHAASTTETKGNMKMVKLHTSQGIITLQLDAEKAPITVQNFLDYVNSGFYNGTIFHRVIPNFMIQGGGFESGMKEKPTKAPIKNEAANGLKNELYTIAMARRPIRIPPLHNSSSTPRTTASSTIPDKMAGAIAYSAKSLKEPNSSMPSAK